MSIARRPSATITRPPEPRSARRRRNRHDEAVIQAEVRRLSHALAPFRILSRAHLAREAGCRTWSEGAFETALNAAIRQGVIEPLPCEFYRDRTNR